MNHRGGIALIQATWMSWLQHRGFFFVLAFGWMIPPLIYLFVWWSAAGDGEIGGMSRGMFVAYYLALILVNQLTYSQTNWTVGDVIREGKLSLSLLRPIPFLYEALSTEAAGKVVYLAFILPVTAVLTLLLRPELHASAAEAALFIPALVFAWALRFFWGYALALLSFWSTRANSLLAVQELAGVPASGRGRAGSAAARRVAKHLGSAAVPLYGRFPSGGADPALERERAAVWLCDPTRLAGAGPAGGASDLEARTETLYSGGRLRCITGGC